MGLLAVSREDDAGEAVGSAVVTQRLNTATYVWEGVAAREPQQWAGRDGGTSKFGHPAAHWQC